MRRWAAALRVPWLGTCRRAYSSGSGSRAERVAVRCGSAGHVSIDLFNDPGSRPESALLIHFPAFATDPAAEPVLPKFLEHLPVASINYRWRPGSHPVGRDDANVPMFWPTPIHDTAFAYAWLVENLAPPKNGRRDIYVYGSHLGAGLATSLALTEANAHSRFGVRGVVAYNGVYNWTMFLPDHRINKPPKRGRTAASATQELIEGSHIHRLREEMPGLFDDPSNLFDAFASPSLFFHSPGLHVSPSFTMSMDDLAAINAMTSDDDDEPLKAQKAPRKSHLIYPPRKSTLKIPETLLLYDSQPQTTPPLTKTGRPRKRVKAPGNSFESQAGELVELMRRSVDVVELKERSKWDEDMQDKEDEKYRRVQAVHVGPETDDTELPHAGQQIVLSWLRDKM
ncbi:60S ribosomal protein L7 [Purpureocillium lavendulum]|uniref:60S ribosomal protein L7 n=1 Tax=Purpureocillium lavendulum TaxID=1247861 RepID=A0AB34FHI2_9HYPO|nr:60S ribosomal protein L7 [Purpureocillium lavendulum]